ncbi:MAG: PorP/SprF family type IX secretion system membrane protein [Luteibaculaceae bacterium]
MKNLVKITQKYAGRILACSSVTVVLFTAEPKTASAQDYQFTQFYAAPINLNPAFAGTEDTRIISNYRNQWSSLPNAFVTYNASIDHFFAEAKSGVALRVTRDQFGSAGLGATEIGFTYAYEMQLSRKFSFRPGVEFAWNQQSIDFNKMVFGDQLINGTAISTTNIDLDRVSYANFAAGGLLYSDDLWVGVSFHNLNEPLTSFRETGNRLPVRSSVHAGYNFKIKEATPNNESVNLMVAANFRSQEQFSALDIGFYYQPSPILFGLWWRGVPVAGLNHGNVFRDAMAFMAGYVSEKHNFRFAYSYDVTISSLGLNSGGSHEVSMQINLFDDAQARKRNKARTRKIPCPKF